MILETIRQVYPQLTKSQRKLADFIANSYQEAAFMTASRLARRLNVNEATVIRFAQRLGYPGYPELIRDVQAVVQEELKTRGEAEAAAKAEEPFVASLNHEVENLGRAVSHVSTETAHRLVALLKGTRRIYVVGQGVSYYLAGAFVASLSGLGLDARLVAGDLQSLALAIADVEGTDAFVGISAGEEGPEVARAIRAAQGRGARTLAVTWSPISASAQAADLALICLANERFPVPSVAVIATFLDALAQTLASLNRIGTERFGQEVEQALRILRQG